MTTYPKHVTIDTSRISAYSKESWLKYAAILRTDHRNAYDVVRAFADALPDPWPTAPGSTARAEHWLGEEGSVRIAVVDEDGDWRVAGNLRVWSVAELIAQGFVPLHDMGAEK